MFLDKKIARYFLCLALSISGLQLPAISQPLEYSKINVAGRVAITIPAHWHVRGLAERKNIAAGADAALNSVGKSSEPMHVSSLSVVSMPEPIRAIVRVSFVPESGTQADLKRQAASNSSQVLADFKNGWEAERPALIEAMTKQGGKYLGQESYRIETIGAHTTLVLSYKRSSIAGGAPFLVTVYQVPMGADKILITLSYQESHAAIFRPILERIKNSIVIDR